MAPSNYIHKKPEPSLFSLPTSNQMTRLINSISYFVNLFPLILSPCSCLKSRHHHLLPGPPKLSPFINFPEPWSISQGNSFVGRRNPGPSVLSLSNHLVPKLGTEVAMLPALELVGLDKVASVGCGPAHVPWGYWPVWSWEHSPG